MTPKEILQICLGIYCSAVILAAIGLAVERYGQYRYDQGRADYHLELITELEAKGGAPVLLYPPEE